MILPTTLLCYEPVLFWLLDTVVHHLCVTFSVVVQSMTFVQCSVA